MQHYSAVAGLFGYADGGRMSEPASVRDRSHQGHGLRRFRGAVNARDFIEDGRLGSVEC